MLCFITGEEGGVKRRSHAMRRDWYETRESPARTIYISDEQYIPDPLAGKRTEAIWEIEEAIWGEVEFIPYGVSDQDLIGFLGHEPSYLEAWDKD